MELALNDKVYVIKKMKARMLRRAIEVKAKVDFENLSVEDLDILVDLTCELYEGQFTRDEFYDGLDGDKLIDTLALTLNRTVDGVLNRLDTFPKEQ